MNSPPTLTKEQADAAIRGIMLGRTLQELELEGGISMEAFLQAVHTDEELTIAFKRAREISTYVLEDELTTKLKLNAAEPEGANKTNALKAWADHAHKQLDARNPAIFSGKATLTSTVPIQIITTLDLNAVKKIDNVYDLTANVTEDRDIITIPDDELANAVLVAPTGGSDTPFSAAIASISEAEAIEAAAARLDAAFDRPEPADGHSSLGESQSAPAPRVKPTAPRKNTRKKPGDHKGRRGKKPTGNEETP